MKDEAFTGKHFRTSTGGKEMALGEFADGLHLGRGWGTDFLKEADQAPKDPPTIRHTDAILEIRIPAELTATNPDILAFEWE